AVPVKIEDLALGARAKLYYRRAGAQSYSSVDFVREKGSKDRFVATVPAYELPGEPRPYELEYYLEVADAAQRRLAGKGNPFEPLRFKVVRTAGTDEGKGPVVEEDHWYKNPLIWVGLTAVAAGATAG